MVCVCVGVFIHKFLHSDLLSEVVIGLDDGRDTRWRGPHGGLGGGQNFPCLGGEESDLLLESPNLLCLEHRQLLQSLHLLFLLSSPASTHFCSLNEHPGTQWVEL